MYLVRRCTILLVILGCGLLSVSIPEVRGHSIPTTSVRGFDGESAPNIVETAGPQLSDSENTKLSASELYLRPQPRRLNLDRMDSFSEPSASEIIRNKRWKLQQITPPGRSRINNRSMPSFDEMESNDAMELDETASRKDSAQLARRNYRTIESDSSESDSITDLVTRAARSTDLEKYLYRFVLDSDLADVMDDSDKDFEDDDDTDDPNPEARFKKKKKFHLKHKLKKYLLPLLLAYKLKFMMMFPAMVGGLILLVKAAGLAGFFFALFASVVSLQKH
ncbi:uncharacterized protein LOC129718468 [Wyeomyia smithii]|uniref:uncharacterized protein LOC129718468 n=1 Tax=Wyeomyia smithii TaxID=174621 RepID=UPI002467E5FF|nr:uncharacterized protein LOC129718468 [Wyeomyia smithii]